ncbi:hypothetical protein LTR37_018922 [Vermiconidia calcicola]|uniref:Uncharacterized protein n=1 Tax=Vermiconidia calcicola TaxID=1690605 RepID=A0ACC3MFP4_9PEZI|nr:hypothetical protein LTR37_018922 [Vermiconidia calcicola]
MNSSTWELCSSSNGTQPCRDYNPRKPAKDKKEAGCCSTQCCQYAINAEDSRRQAFETQLAIPPGGFWADRDEDTWTLPEDMTPEGAAHEYQKSRDRRGEIITKHVLGDKKGTACLERLGGTGSGLNNTKRMQISLNPLPIHTIQLNLDGNRRTNTERYDRWQAALKGWESKPYTVEDDRVYRNWLASPAGQNQAQAPAAPVVAQAQNMPPPPQRGRSETQQSGSQPTAESSATAGSRAASQDTQRGRSGPQQQPRGSQPRAESSQAAQSRAPSEINRGASVRPDDAFRASRGYRNAAFRTSDSLPESRGSGKRRAAESPSPPDSTRNRLKTIKECVDTTYNELAGIIHFMQVPEEEQSLEYINRWTMYRNTLARCAVMKKTLGQQQPIEPEFDRAKIELVKVVNFVKTEQEVLRKWLPHQSQKTQEFLISMVPASVELGSPPEDRPSSRPKSKAGSLPEHHRDRLRD